MAEFAKRAVRGDLVKSMAAIADITGIDEPPLHLAVATAGLQMVRGRFTELMDEYARWEPVTAAQLFASRRRSMYPAAERGKRIATCPATPPMPTTMPACWTVSSQ